MNMNWSDNKSKDKELTQLFWNKFSVSDFSTVLHHLFFLTCHVFKTCFELSRVKLCTIVPEKRSIYHHLPSIPCAYSGWLLLVCVMKTWILLSFREISTALRMRYEGKLGLSVISHLSLGEQNDLLIKLSCFLIWPCDLSLVICHCLSVLCTVKLTVFLNNSFR